VAVEETALAELLEEPGADQEVGAAEGMELVDEFGEVAAMVEGDSFAEFGEGDGRRWRLRGEVLAWVEVVVAGERGGAGGSEGEGDEEGGAEAHGVHDMPV